MDHTNPGAEGPGRRDTSERDGGADSLLADSVLVGTRQTIEGQGRYRTTVHTSTSAFRVFYQDAAQARGLSASVGGNLTLENLTIRDPSTSTTTYRAAVYAEAPLLMRDVAIHGFVHGVRMRCDVTLAGVLRSNCNGSYLENVNVYSAQHAGIYYRGGDAQAGLLLGGDFTYNCDAYEHWESEYGVLQACASIQDESLIGNTFVAPKSSSVESAVMSVPSNTILPEVGRSSRRMASSSRPILTSRTAASTWEST